MAFIPQLLGFIGAGRLSTDPQNAIADFIVAHRVEIAIVEKLSDYILPGSGTAERLLLFMLEKSHPMDQAEANEWMRRQNTET